MGLQQTEQRETCTDGPTLHPQTWDGHLLYRQGPGAETQASEDRSGTGLGLAVQRQPKGVRVW